MDTGLLGELLIELGSTGAQDVVCRAIEELSQRLTEAERLYQSAAFPDLRKTVRSLVGIADQLGMWGLARGALHVVDCIDQGDPVALAATHERLLRVGEASLAAVWDLQGLSV